MVDISCLKPYITTYDIFDTELLEEDIKQYGRDEVWKQRFKDIDCTRVLPNGMHLIQTIGYRYKSELSLLLAFIDSYYSEEEKDAKYIEILERHNANLEFEKLNPPTEYKKKQGKKKATVKEVIDKIKPKKMSVAERKLVAKIGKINALSIKLKPKT